MRFALVDMTNGTTCTDGSKLTSQLLDDLASAITIQLNRDFSSEYGGNYSARRIDNVTQLEEGEYPFAFLPALADAPGAIALHTVDGNGMPLLFDGISLSDSVNSSGNSLTVAASHECIETAADEGTNMWCDDGNGNEVAFEPCDPFESQSYQIGSIWVSNFALRSYYVPNRKGPYSYMAKTGNVRDALKPLTLGSGLGYQITKTYNPTSVHSVACEGNPRRPNNRRSSERGIR